MIPPCYSYVNTTLGTSFEILNEKTDRFQQYKECSREKDICKEKNVLKNRKVQWRNYSSIPSSKIRVIEWLIFEKRKDQRVDMENKRKYDSMIFMEKANYL